MSLFMSKTFVTVVKFEFSTDIPVNLLVRLGKKIPKFRYDHTFICQVVLLLLLLSADIPVGYTFIPINSSYPKSINLSMCISILSGCSLTYFTHTLLVTNKSIGIISILHIYLPKYQMNSGS